MAWPKMLSTKKSPEHPTRPKKKARFLTLGTKMALLSFASVVLAVVIGGFIVVSRVSYELEMEMGRRALAIARTLSQMDAVQKTVGTAEGFRVIPPLAERTRLATGVEYIVILDMNGIRYSHPLSERIGKRFEDQDLAPALANNEYISRATGVLGPSVRAFVPILVGEEPRQQVGVVVVGILTPTMAAILRRIQAQLYSSLGLGLLLGLAGALYLARHIKRAMFSLEPEEIASLLEEREAIFQAMGEGVLAIDAQGKVSFANDQAKKLLGVKEEITGKKVTELLPGSQLPAVLKTGQPVVNQELRLGQVMLLANQVPIRARGEIIGAVATLQDKTEVRLLAEELTGVRTFVEALRVQNHEYLNKLHTIAGLIQLRKYNQACDYIFDITEKQQAVNQLIKKKITDSGVAGLLLGKFSRAGELKVELQLDPASNLSGLPVHLQSSDLVLIIGNLLENAFDAVRELPQERRRVYLKVVGTKEGLELTVRDRGPGIPEHLADRIYEKGFTTKGPNNQGLGLYLVKQQVEVHGGQLAHRNLPEGGAEFLVSFGRPGPPPIDHTV